jgi:uncharacterized protein
MDHDVISPELRRRIGAELEGIEREEAVRILLAVESGSRAWGFPSRDSDYDVRFLYVRPIEAYLTVTPRRDVIERAIDATLDVSGWDLRKALQLMLRSNAVLIEWLTSPVHYRDWAGREELLGLARSAASLTALAYHYQHQARRSFDAVCAAGDAAPLKSYCYALRSALAVTWIRRRGAAMSMTALMAELGLPEELVQPMRELIVQKREAVENETMPRSAVFDAFIADALAPPVPQAPAAPRAETSARADAILAALLFDGAGIPQAGPGAGTRRASTCS